MRLLLSLSITILKDKFHKSIYKCQIIIFYNIMYYLEILFNMVIKKWFFILYYYLCSDKSLEDRFKMQYTNAQRCQQIQVVDLLSNGHFCWSCFSCLPDLVIALLSNPLFSHRQLFLPCLTLEKSTPRRTCSTPQTTTGLSHTQGSEAHIPAAA